MRLPDIVLAAIPLMYLFAVLGLLPLDAQPVDALLLGSVAAAIVIGHALFVDPPR